MSPDVRFLVMLLENCRPPQAREYAEALEGLRSLYRTHRGNFPAEVVARIQAAKGRFESRCRDYTPKGPTPCDECDGGEMTCRMCKGLGCHVCGGRGKHRCPHCGGTGREPGAMPSEMMGGAGFASDVIWDLGPEW
jgi:hypothetical protein